MDEIRAFARELVKTHYFQELKDREQTLVMIALCRQNGDTEGAAEFQRQLDQPRPTLFSDLPEDALDPESPQ